MHRPKVNPAPESLPVVAEARARADAEVHALIEAGVAAESAELEAALGRNAPVVLVCPDGWEASCRRVLAELPSRECCPPAILIASGDPEVRRRVGPAHSFLSLPLDPRRTAAIWSRARQDQERFAARWPTAVEEFSAGDAQEIASLLERATGLDIRADRQGPFLQALRARLVGRLAPSLGEYAALARDPEEMEALAALLSVGETHFWRYSGQYLVLQALLRELRLAGKGAPPLRVWSAGCATGEEAYSLAIACLEGVGPDVDLEVVGTDINAVFLETARDGVYRERSLRNLPGALRARYLESVPGGARVRAEVRERVRFDLLNLGGRGLSAWTADNGPFRAVFCRNTLIYLSRRASSRVLDALGACLLEGGGLFLGASEGMLSRRPALEVCRGKGSFYFRKLGEGTESGAAPEVGEGRDSRCAGLWAAGLAALDEEDRVGARKAFEEILRGRPDDARGHVGTALLLADEGREGEAERALERAAQRLPVLPEGLYLRGLLAERRGDDGEALRWYGQASVLSPGFVMAHVNRAWVLRRLGRGGEFVEEMRAAQAILKTRPPPASWLTGGVGAEGLRDLVSAALAEEAAP